MSYGRPPPDVEGMTSLKVDNLTYRTSPETLRRVFEKYGRVGDVYIPRDRYTKESRGFAFVRFHDKRDAEDAMDAMDGALLDGRELRVQMARYGRPPDSMYSRRGAPPRRYGGRSASPRRRRRSRSKSRSRSRSRSRRRYSRSRSRSYSRSRSRSKSKSKSKSRTPRRSKSKSPSRSRSKSRSHTPPSNRGSRSRSKSKSRPKSPEDFEAIP
ncbi:serine and arginine rich splicing factor 2a [Nerophis lumbriciformis]|uniref:serine and arginine rich splicing factor 2a n=1 Tax=Nerophis lumbriciformis TaxID=546530 RepID=UPI002AE03917|nr:serine/arginine-rich splicing factor 2-like [Nerophis lumbriciformis]XP_061788123.1 serine/arginine-rich splicing factor 2-like [Nerophis lumbriciformis]XP_061788126.1 serine/arginine-rich splicing factor 2-like [Nerophis lumbriciformis]XP_061913180.1 serine and arginine rich splicing factor 2a [Entelurus aequoreus]XP_061913181.1 serine and arginine rich splicing factor 2a [Entelurus aequoreus]XP_061913182.1 serine and arginine rich splicing factor 2a [Entelurus aequoreus]